MRSVLVSWIGKTDLRAPKESLAVGLGPIAQALDGWEFDHVLLVTDYPRSEVGPFVRWLTNRSTTPIEVVEEKISGPTDFGDIYQAAIRACVRALGDRGHETRLTFHLSPGSPPMAAVWILLAKTLYPADLIESSREHGVRTANVPFDIYADFIPDLLRERDERMARMAAGEPPEAPEFSDIIHKTRVMARVIRRASQVAPSSQPVLIEGESGTGKELLARAIHRASSRRDGPFIGINCGAIPENLVEAELFGHEKGAFTDAKQMRKGHFESANGGTLFLDELGELPPVVQVKLLRVLQEGEVVRLGASKPVKVNVRIIAATNRSLTEQIANGKFREDLFYRLAVAVLQLPPLRDRMGDLGLLIDHLLEQVNSEAERDSGLKRKKLSAGARTLLMGHSWPGNVRELLNTLHRAVIWSEGPTIGAEDIREALLPAVSQQRPEVLNRPLGEGLKLADLLAEVARHYLGRAMEEAQGNKTRAAELVGLPSYQTLTNWLGKYGI